MDVATRLGLSGFLATAVAYGPARMGFGLYLPELRSDLGVSSGIAGVISSSAFAAFLLSVPAGSWVTRTRGPRAAVLVGLLLAGTGMALVAVAPSIPVLALGVVLAGASPGWCWIPFNDGAAALVAEDRRPRVLSVVSTGTTLGIALAAVLAVLGLFAGLSWRWSWTGFALVALLALATGRALIPSRAVFADAGFGTGTASSERLTARLAWPVAAACSFGVTSSVYLSFAVDAVARADGPGGLPPKASGAVVFLALGTCGLVGLAAAGIERRLGLVGILVAVFVASSASALLLASAAGSLPGVLVSAGLQGACIMTISAVLSFWTTRLRPEDPSRAFGVVLGAVGAGSVAGPVLAGLALDGRGDTAVFGVAAALSLLTTVALVVGRGTVRGLSGAPRSG